MLLLYRSPIPVGRRGVFYLLKDFYLPSRRLEGGGGSVSCDWGTRLCVRSWLPLPLYMFINPLLFIKNKQLLIPKEGFSALEKTALYVPRGKCCPSNQVWQLAAVMAIWHTFLKIWKCWIGRDCLLQIVMTLWRTLNLEKMVPNDDYYLQRAIMPSQITRQNSLQRAGGPYRQ
jgi:hypothetical protein